MKIAATKDFKRPRGKVFGTFADPARMDAVLGSFGKNLRREGSGGVGTVWHLDVVSAGNERPVASTLAGRDAPGVLNLRVTSEMVDADVAFVFTDLPERGCQVAAELDLAPHTLAARVGIQTLRLAKGKVEQKIQRTLTMLGRPD